MTNNNPFNSKEYDLGDNRSGIDRLGVDQSFSSLHHYATALCIICTNTPAYKLVPKYKHLQTAEMDSKGFVCEHCLKEGYVNPDNYGIRKL